MRKGFTLIELLIVIAILAVVSTVVMLVLNPLELLARARDSQRISDLANVKKSVARYLTTSVSPTLPSMNQGYATVSTTCGFASSSTCTVVTSTAVTGLGWVPIDLTQSAGGAGMSSLPRDPTNSVSYQYAFLTNKARVTFKILGRLESTKYKDTMKNDGGIKNNCTTYLENQCWYELGTDMSL